MNLKLPKLKKSQNLKKQILIKARITLYEHDLTSFIDSTSIAISLCKFDTILKLRWIRFFSHFLQQLYVKKCYDHPVYGAEIRIHDFRNTSLLP